jgi:hypothetical protein
MHALLFCLDGRADESVMTVLIRLGDCVASVLVTVLMTVIMTVSVMAASMA